MTSKPLIWDRLSATDPNSFSNPESARVEEFKLRWTVDFEKEILVGSVTYEIVRVDPTADFIIFDTNMLNIKSVHWPKDGRRLEHTLGKVDPKFGCSLKVNLPETDPDLIVNQKVSILIDYETSPKARGLQWLPPEQTQGNKFPFLFSHAEPIHARSFFPCQDTPSVKAPYTSEVTAPKSFTVLMSGLRACDPELINGQERRHKFRQSIPIPSYLVAIVIARLAQAKIGPRTTLWAEDEFLEEAAFDFADTEEMLQTAEGLIGTYVWGVYDLLVLPRSFPFGGMENPCLTYVTPTLLTSDKSLSNVIAHEIAHSWTGNLVTNSTFEHFWLNEGFTVYLERWILGKMKGEEYRQFLFIGGWKELKECVKTLEEDNPMTSLVLDLSGISPDDSFSTIPYEKGCVFLKCLEDTVGLELFEAFLVEYIETNKTKSIDSKEFKRQFIEYFTTTQNKSVTISGIEWVKWFLGRGMPPYEPEYDNSLVKVCNELVEKWKMWDPKKPCPFKKKDLTRFHIRGPQIKEFLAELFEDEDSKFDSVKAKAMETAYELNSIKNCEIKCIWLRLCIKVKWIEQVPLALDFITEQGRLKFIRPIYRDLYAWEEERPKAIATFKKNRAYMMYVAVTAVMKDLLLEK